MAWAANRLATEQRAAESLIAGKDWRRGRWPPARIATYRIEVWWREVELAASFLADLAQEPRADD
jgi:hypothetical protein